MLGREIRLDSHKRHAKVVLLGLVSHDPVKTAGRTSSKQVSSRLKGSPNGSAARTSLIQETSRDSGHIKRPEISLMDPRSTTRCRPKSGAIGGKYHKSATDSGNKPQSHAENICTGPWPI